MPSQLTNHQRPPVVDEWGIYDPEQAGLAAVLQRLEARRGAAVMSPADGGPMARSMREASVLVIRETK